MNTSKYMLKILIYILHIEFVLEYYVYLHKNAIKVEEKGEKLR